MTDLQEKELLYLKAKKYYYAGDEIMSDFEFDTLEEELKTAGSTVMSIVGSKHLVSKATKIKHLSAMLSLDKINSRDNVNLKPVIDEAYAWMKMMGIPLDTEIEAGPKFDGSSMNLTYINRMLSSGGTRGDGEYGFDQIQKLKHIVPNFLDADIDIPVEIRGEVVMPKETFDRKYAHKFKNARNLVAGILSKDTIDLDMVKDLIFVAYDIRFHRGNEILYSTKINTFALLTQLGFNDKHPVYYRMFKIKDIAKIYHEFKEYREKHATFLLDGMVLKVPEKLRADIGETGHHPKWAIAIKFPPKEAFTEIISIDWKTGSTGEVVPTAVMKPVDLDGSTVQRATLFNKDKISTMGAYPGATVLIAKAGDIIPQIYKVVKKSTQAVGNPTKCPTCGSTLVEDPKHLWCVNDTCFAQVLSKLSAGIRIFNIKELGQSTLTDFYNAGFKRIEDFFDKTKFNEAKLIQSGYFQTGRSLDVKLDSVNAVTKVTLAQVINSMKLLDTGSAVSEQVSRYMSDVSYDFGGLNKAAVDRITTKGSPEYGRLVLFLDLLKANFIEVEYFKVIDKSQFKTYEMTGTPPSAGDLKHKGDYINLFKTHGYLNEALTEESDYLLVADMATKSGKMQKLQKLNAKGHNIIVMTYTDFVKNVIGLDQVADSMTSLTSTKPTATSQKVVPKLF